MCECKHTILHHLFTPAGDGACLHLHCPCIGYVEAQPEQHWFWLSCPRCGARIGNQLFTTKLAYRIHCMGHRIADLERSVGILSQGGDPRPWPR